MEQIKNESQENAVVEGFSFQNIKLLQVLFHNMLSYFVMVENDIKFFLLKCEIVLDFFFLH